MTHRFERFSLALTEISKAWHKLTADEMEKYGLKGTHSVYLLALYRHPEGLTAPQLCEICGRDKSDVSRMVGALERSGMVCKEGVGQSLYRGVFKLSKSGVEAAEFVRRRAGLAVELAGSDLTDSEREAFYTALETVSENLRRLAKDGLPQE